MINKLKLSVLFLFLLISIAVEGQSTATITATVVDSGGCAYKNGTYNWNMTDSSGNDLTPGSIIFFGSTPGYVQPIFGFLDAFGKMSVNPFINSSISNPSGTKWNFSICSQNPNSAPLPNSIPPMVCFKTTGYNVVGNADVTSSLTIPTVGCGGGGGGGGGGVNPGSPLNPAQYDGTGHNVQSITSPNFRKLIGEPMISVIDYGATNDAKKVADGVMSSGSPTLTSASGLFTSNMVGKTISVQYAGGTAGSNLPLVTTVASFSSATSITLSASATQNVSAAGVIWGTDNYTSFNSWVSALSGNKGLIPCPTAGTGYLINIAQGSKTLTLGSNETITMDRSCVIYIVGALIGSTQDPLFTIPDGTTNLMFMTPHIAGEWQNTSNTTGLAQGFGNAAAFIAQGSGGSKHIQIIGGLFENMLGMGVKEFNSNDTDVQILNNSFISMADTAMNVNSADTIVKGNYCRNPTSGGGGCIEGSGAESQYLDNTSYYATYNYAMSFGGITTGSPYTGTKVSGNKVFFPLSTQGCYGLGDGFTYGYFDHNFCEITSGGFGLAEVQSGSIDAGHNTIDSNIFKSDVPGSGIAYYIHTENNLVTNNLDSGFAFGYEGFQSGSVNNVTSGNTWDGSSDDITVNFGASASMKDTAVHCTIQLIGGAGGTLGADSVITNSSGYCYSLFPSAFTAPVSSPGFTTTGNGSSGNQTHTPFTSTSGPTGGYNIFTLYNNGIPFSATANNSTLSFGVVNSGTLNKSQSWIGAEYDSDFASQVAIFAAAQGNTSLNSYDSLRGLTLQSNSTASPSFTAANTYVLGYMGGGNAAGSFTVGGAFCVGTHTTQCTDPGEGAIEYGTYLVGPATTPTGACNTLQIPAGWVLGQDGGIAYCNGSTWTNPLSGGILGLNNTWTGTNTFNNTVNIGRQVFVQPGTGTISSALSTYGASTSYVLGCGNFFDNVTIAASGIDIVGGGPLCTVVKPNTLSSPVFTIQQTGTAGTFYTRLGRMEISAAGLSSTSDGVVINTNSTAPNVNTVFTTIDTVRIDNMGGNGLNILGGPLVLRATDLHLVSNAGNGLNVVPSSPSSEPVNSMNFDGLYSFLNGKYGVYVSLNSATQWIFHHPDIEQNGASIVGGAGCAGMYFTVSTSLIRSVTIDGGGYFEANCNNSTQADAAHIRITGTGSAVGFNIRDNFFSSAGVSGCGVYVDAAVSSGIISGNVAAMASSTCGADYHIANSDTSNGSFWQIGNNTYLNNGNGEVALSGTGPKSYQKLDFNTGAQLFSSGIYADSTVFNASGSGEILKSDQAGGWIMGITSSATNGFVWQKAGSTQLMALSTAGVLTVNGLVSGCLQSTSGVISSTGSACGAGGGGGATSVGLALPASVFSVSGSPVTTSGVLTGAFVTQSANLVFAGPATGAAATPTFRSLVAADLPIATSSVVGGVSISTGLSISGGGAVTLNLANANTWTATQTHTVAGVGVDMSGSSQIKLPVGATYVSAANGELGYATTTPNWHIWNNGADSFILTALASGSFTNNHCAQFTVSSGAISISDSGSACGGGGGSPSWSNITNPSANLSLTMGADTTLFTYNATTGSGVDLFKLTDTTNNTGTGILLHATTASGSVLTPFQADFNGKGFKVDNNGNLVGVGTSTSNQFQIPASSGGVASGVASTAIFSTDSVGNGYLSESGGTSSRLCDASNFACGAAHTVVDTTSTVTLVGSFLVENHFNENATAAQAVVYTLPTASAGALKCVWNANNGTNPNTGQLTLQTSASGQFIIFTDGTLTATGGFVQSGGAIVDSACVLGIDSTHWMLKIGSGTWSKH